MKRFFLLFLFLFLTHLLLACDFCNCYLGLNPQYKKNTFGIRYHTMFYNGSHMSNEDLAMEGFSKNDFLERRTNIELHGQWYPVQKLQIVYSLPYVMSNECMRGNETGGDRIAGVGDPIVLANYQLFNHMETDSTYYSHRLLAGAGIKAPLGKWKLDPTAEADERVHLPGTGSWDYLASAVYLGKYKRTGFNLNVTYLITTTNKQSFQFANRFNANATAYYQVKVKETMFYPNLGVYLEQAGKDLNGNSILENSGGKILFAHAGLDFYFRKFSINTAFQLPMMQELNENQPEMKYRFIVGFSYALN